MILGANETAKQERMIPVRMLNEFTYCPRLFFLEFVQGEFVDNEFTIQGRGVHRRVDGPSGPMPDPAARHGSPYKVRSLELQSETLGLSGKIDIVAGDGDVVTPIDFKRGRLPVVPEGAYEPERVQLCAYGLLLREKGYTCNSGLLWFAESKRKVEVLFDDALVSRTLELLADAKRVGDQTEMPGPLKGSPKCGRCSLNPVCMPDEVNALVDGEGEPRQLLVPRADAKPLYVQQQGTKVGLDGDSLVVRDRDGKKLADVGMPLTSQVVLVGNVQISSQAMRELFIREIPVTYMGYGGRILGITETLSHNNIEVRRSQFRIADDRHRSLVFARGFVRTKILNCRTLLRRNGEGDVSRPLRELHESAERAKEAASIEELLGIEGNAASVYFKHFSRMLKPQEGEEAAFDFTVRTRRPPKDPVNALLSLGYSLLARDMTFAARAAGLEPLLGFYHQPRHRRPALSLDLMEEFRPVIADSIVLFAINTGEIRADDFVQSGLGVCLRPEARGRFISAYERRMAEEVTHPVFGYKVEYRRVLAVQCRLLARVLTGEVPSYPNFLTR